MLLSHVSDSERARGGGTGVQLHTHFLVTFFGEDHLFPTKFGLILRTSFHTHILEVSAAPASYCRGIVSQVNHGFLELVDLKSVDLLSLDILSIHFMIGTVDDKTGLGPKFAFDRKKTQLLT